jgi:hypothetical protein
VLKAIEDPLYKAKLTQQRNIKENAHRMTATQRCQRVPASCLACVLLSYPATCKSVLLIPCTMFWCRVVIV